MEEDVLFSANFRARECPEMRSHAENLVSGNVQACCAVAIFFTAQAPSTSAQWFWSILVLAHLRRAGPSSGTRCDHDRAA